MTKDTVTCFNSLKKSFQKRCHDIIHDICFTSYFLTLIFSFSSLHNPLEREYVLALCQAITSRTPIKPGSIGMITPYKQQKHLLKQRFHQDESLKAITVNTIDGYQGQEKEVIILSCVRGRNQNNTIGFLSHPQRMNVALTRAKKTLVILANQSVQVNSLN